MDQQPLLVLSSGFTDKHSNHNNQRSIKQGQYCHETALKKNRPDKKEKVGGKEKGRPYSKAMKYLLHFPFYM